MKNIIKYESPIGALRIVIDNDALTEIDLDSEASVAEDCINSKTPFVSKVISQLDEYFAGKRKTFDLTVNPKGTEFQRKDWEALQRIPYGETRTYKDIAEEIGCPKGFRAVGLANNRNPIMIVIPCHRVIGADGSLTGYAGGVHIKKYLLELEGVILSD